MIARNFGVFVTVALLALAGCATGTTQAPTTGNGNGSGSAAIPDPLTPPPAEIAWLLRSWRGALTAWSPAPPTAIFQFTQNGEMIRWSVNISSPYVRPSKAVGTATIVGKQVTLTGRYVETHHGGFTGVFDFTEDGTLRGGGVAHFNTPYSTTLYAE